MVIIEFFRDTLSGIYYYIYVALNILFIFAIIGYVAECKEEEQINNDVMNLDGAVVDNNIQTVKTDINNN